MTQITDLVCTGCCACMNACPISAIKMDLNNLGELSPSINKDICSNCNLCKSVCPQNKDLPSHYPFNCYAVWTKNKKLRKNAASGGFVSAIAEYFLTTEENIMYYCDYDDNMDLRYFELRTNADIYKLAGSKYSQVDADYTYKEIKQYLNNSKKVIFISLPCQIAGLLSYLNHDYSNLITIDMVCHGAPPNTYLKQYVESLCGTTRNCSVEFKKKYKQFFTLFKNNKIVYKKHHSQDLYFTAFYQNAISRNSCYTCKYATDKRISDITIGDFWGLGKLNTLKKPSKWTSLVLINTKKGFNLFNSISNLFLIEKRDVAEGIRGNGRLQKAPGKSDLAISFQNQYPDKGFVDSVKSISLTKTKRYSFTHLKKLISTVITILVKLRNIMRRIIK